MDMIDRISAVVARAAAEIKSLREGGFVPPYLTYEEPLVAGSVITCVAPWVTTTYQWKRDGVNIAGATAATYTLVTADTETSITCVASGSDLLTGGIDMPVIETGDIEVTGLPVWSAALTAVAEGTSNARYLALGDSITAGYGANSTAMTANDRANSWPSLLAKSITTDGLYYASWQSFVGNAGNEGTATAYDSRVTFGAGWDFSDGFGDAGKAAGGYHFMSTTATNKLNFHPTGNCDTFEMYYAKTNENAGAGFKYSVNNGAQDATVSTYDAAGAAGKYTLTRALADNTLNVQAANTTASFLAGIVAYNSAVKEITVMNAGWSGATIADLIVASDGWAPLNTYSLYGAHLVSVLIGTNDYATSEANFKARYNTLITQLQANGSDILIITPPPANLQAAAINTVAGWCIDVANANSLPYIDLRTVFGSYAAANAAGYMRDDWHPNAAGYAVIAAAVKARIMPA